MKKFPILPCLAAFCAVLLPAKAQWIQNAGGTFDYESPANWNGGIINNLFLTNFAAPLTLTFGANYTLSSQMVLSCSNGLPVAAPNITFQSATSSPQTIKFSSSSTNGGIAISNAVGGLFTVGTAVNPLILDLNGTTNCVIGGASGTSGGTNTFMQINAQVIDSGGAANLLKIGGDRVFAFLNNTNNSFVGPVSFYALRGGGFTSIKPIGGGASALGAPVDATTGTITAVDSGSFGTLGYFGTGDTSDRPFVFNVSFSNAIANAYQFANEGTGLLKLTGQMSFPTNATKQSQFVFYASNAPLELDGYIRNGGNPTNGGFYTYLCFAGTPGTSTNRITLNGATNDFRDFLISNVVFAYASTASAGVPSAIGAGTNVVLGGSSTTATGWLGNAGQGSSLQYTGPTNATFTRNVVINANGYVSCCWALDNATSNTSLTWSNNIIWAQGANANTTYGPRFLYINTIAPSTNTVLSYLPDAGIVTGGQPIGVTVGVANPYGAAFANGGLVQLLNPTNTFGGGVMIAYARTLQVANLANIGQPSSIGTGLNNTGTNNQGPYFLENGVYVPITGINLGSPDSARGGILSYVGTNNASCNHHVTVFGSATFNSAAVEVCGFRNDSPNNSSVHFTDPSPWVLQPQGAAGGSNAYEAVLGGTAVTTNTLDSVLGDMTNYLGSITPNSGHLLVNGSAWRLTANQTYSGTSMVANATLLVNGSIAPGLGVTVGSGGVLSGTGTVNENVNVLTNGTIAAGDGSLGTLTINGNLTNAGTLFMKLNASSGTSDHLALGGNTLAYGNGILAVTNLAGTLTNGSSFTLFNAGSFIGSISSVSPAIPAGGLAWDLTGLPSGVLKVVTGAYSQPKITGIVSTGSSIILSVTNGSPGTPYNVLSATNITTPLSNWVSVASGTFDSHGGFAVTNAMSGPQRYYVIKAP